MTDLHIVADADAAARVAADRIIEVAAAGGHIALAGGSTPKRAYRLVAESGADLSRATFWYSDERCVPAGHALANSTMVAESMLDSLPEARRPRVHRIEGELGAEEAADRYELLLHAELGDNPSFDLLLLGMGPDSHTASLFPGKPGLDEHERLVAPVPEAGMEPQVPRVTFTFPLIDAARQVLLLVAGADKAPAAARAFGPDRDPAAPSGRLAPSPGSLLVVLDEAAAAELPR